MIYITYPHHQTIPQERKKKKKKECKKTPLFAPFKQGRTLESFIYPCFYGAKNVP
jgi:hypothetical protein